VADPPDDLVNEQIAYYAARAPEYDAMLNREKRYELDGLDVASFDADTRELAIAEKALDALGPTGEVLELACGPGWWTKRLARNATSITAVDASAEMLEINRRRVPGDGIHRIQSDIFSWRPDRRYDLVFFSFWLSHVPRDRFIEFWDLVAAALKPGGRVFFIDEAAYDGGDGYEAMLDGGRGAAVRRLDDGREFRMVKVYYKPEELQQELATLGWDARVELNGARIYHGKVRRSEEGRADH
jgi:demethylmenaquinone methyltransferase/2-methoxy-6-polyprenyl-1,4-benzoquinol methylase